MKRNDIVIGIVILAVLAGVIYFVRRPKQKVEELPQPTTEEKIEEAFRMDIPDDVEKAELKDVSGGTASGIATRKVAGGQFVFSVLADLPDDGNYRVFLGEEGRSLGTMRVAKGGYLLEFTSATDYSEQNKVMVRMGETTVLEGSF